MLWTKLGKIPRKRLAWIRWGQKKVFSPNMCINMWTSRCWLIQTCGNTVSSGPSNVLFQWFWDWKSSNGGEGTRMTAHCASPLDSNLEVPPHRHSRYHVRCHSRYLGKKSGTKMSKFRGFIDPSDQNELYHTPLLSKIWDLGLDEKSTISTEESSPLDNCEYMEGQREGRQQ